MPSIPRSATGMSAWPFAASPATYPMHPSLGHRLALSAATGTGPPRPASWAWMSPIETSGSVPALHQAIRATRFGGTICMISFYGRDATGLYLGDEFHVNRLRLISARSESLPMRDAPGWTLDRMVRLGLDWLASGRFRVDGDHHADRPVREERGGLPGDRRASRAIDQAGHSVPVTAARIRPPPTDHANMRPSRAASRRVRRRQADHRDPCIRY